MESRKPYIFYNTWNFQKRNRNWYKKPYLADMTQERMIKEIEVAHQMGIEVFVIDAGWFEKTGYWEPSKTRFPNQLKDIKKLLVKYNMKLGLWFDPTAAAISSKMLAKNRDCVKTWNGKEDKPNKIWETEESYRMCLVSKYRDDFADELIRIAKATGVSISSGMPSANMDATIRIIFMAMRITRRKKELSLFHLSWKSP